MNSLKKPLLWTIALAPLFLNQPVSAHVIWFEKINDNQHEIIFGHPEENKPEPLDIEKFQSATAYDENHKVIPSTTSLENGRLFLKTNSPASALTAFYDNGFWRENPDETYDNISQEEAEAINYENVSQFVKYAKSLSAWNESLAQPFNLPIEIMPLENPLNLEAGDNLPIQVLFAENIVDAPLVEYLGETINVNSNGTAIIPIGESGLEVIEASYTDLNSNNPEISYAATFSAQSNSVPAIPEPQNLGLFASITFFGLAQTLKGLRLKKRMKTNKFDTVSFDK
ncbi:MAG: DUF4198 domain-containing protein [Gomphosphaeria aponina SAG 52.96 = DSM 107014]|uniref:DUF4198 domain-containing protein n=1 Tax=Gomphosphaeria aponina SAG 52.96 = DSM 107014 TaxID=1521640 RepID=A0A941GV98_9CHRO|nr:DUF4198 domain-containing protein [Gomphosphaeria aponina SAG 52.96 = DSM 107014]